MIEKFLHIPKAVGVSLIITACVMIALGLILPYLVEDTHTAVILGGFFLDFAVLILIFAIPVAILGGRRQKKEKRPAASKVRPLPKYDFEDQLARYQAIVDEFGKGNR